MDCAVHRAWLSFVLIGVALNLPLPAGAGFLDRFQADDGIPAVADAFRLQPALWADGEVVLGWDIAPGCYLYRDRLRVQVLEPQGLALGEPALPHGEPHEDVHFGQTEVYRNDLRLRFRPPGGQPPKRLQVQFQGCAQDKVCYPVQTREITVDGT